jgi:hypothetical protein
MALRLGISRAPVIVAKLVKKAHKPDASQERARLFVLIEFLL